MTMLLSNVPPVPYADPWNQTLAQRLSMLTRGGRRIAYFYEAPNNSTFRYRAYNMAQVLNADISEGVSASYFYRSDYANFDEIADYADTLVICRSRYNAELSHLIAKFRARNRRVLFDIDDLVFDPRYTRLVVNTLGLDAYDDHVWDQWFAMISRLGAALQLCDGAITTNRFLADRISAYAGLPTAVVPNFLNREQLELSDRVYAGRVSESFTHPGKIRLGYFSGSPSHRLDYAIVERAVAELMVENENLELVVVGYIETTEALAGIMRRVHKIPFQDYVNLQGVIGAVDFNLMPLQSNAFTDCKSELKFFDAAAVGTLSIASPSYTYKSVIDHGSNGYLSRAHEWKTVISAAIENMGRYADLAENAREVALTRYTWKTQRSAIMESLNA